MTENAAATRSANLDRAAAYRRAAAEIQRAELSGNPKTIASAWAAAREMFDRYASKAEAR